MTGAATRTGVLPARAANAWESLNRAAVILVDLLVIATGLAVGLDSGDGSLEIAQHLPGALATMTGVVLVFALAVMRAWDPSVLARGAEEYRRVGRAAVLAVIILGLTGLALGQGHFRLWVFAVLPAISAALVAARFAARKVVHHRRAVGRCMLPVLAAGSIDELVDLITRTRRERHYGWQVEAVCTPDGLGEHGSGEVAGVPVVGTLSDTAQRAWRGGYRIVAVAPDHGWTRDRLRGLAWDLEGSQAHLVVAPVLMEVTGPRLHVTPVFGMPLLHVTAPVFTGARRLVKTAFDRVAAAGVLFLTAPLILTLALLVWREDRGPVFFRQVRVGKDGRPFTMLKFRSMVIDAEARLAGLQTSNEAAGPLFKLRSDPRITRIGAWLRKYSLDELPQLINVLSGAMSLVGPRPPLPSEVSSFGPESRRRFKVKPGLTGLWQVSGRSDLSWHESVRLDLRYVENWSLAMDFVILWKTSSAVLRASGAY